MSRSSEYLQRKYKNNFRTWHKYRISMNGYFRDTKELGSRGPKSGWRVTTMSTAAQRNLFLLKVIMGGKFFLLSHWNFKTVSSDLAFCKARPFWTMTRCFSYLTHNWTLKSLFYSIFLISLSTGLRILTPMCIFNLYFQRIYLSLNIISQLYST